MATCEFMFLNKESRHGPESFLKSMPVHVEEWYHVFNMRRFPLEFRIRMRNAADGYGENDAGMNKEAIRMVLWWGHVWFGEAVVSRGCIYTRRGKEKTSGQMRKSLKKKLPLLLAAMRRFEDDARLGRPLHFVEPIR